MIIGLKTGPRNFEDGKRTILEDGAAMCELWYNIHKQEMYVDIIKWLEKHGVSIALHHWGVMGGRYKSNLTTNNQAVRSETVRQIQETIDIASTLSKTAYVNAHPGGRYLETTDLETGEQALMESEHTPPEEADSIFLETCEYLQEYANSRGVMLTIETLPGSEAPSPNRREEAYMPDNVPLSTMERIGDQGCYIANDITHTAGQLALESNTLTSIWKGLYGFTKRTASHTRLLHINTVVPPYNGTDSHHGITEHDFVGNEFPNRTQIKQLLSLFKTRDDVYVLTEPQMNAVQSNFRALKQLVEESRE